MNQQSNVMQFDVGVEHAEKEQQEQFVVLSFSFFRNEFRGETVETSEKMSK